MNERHEPALYSAGIPSDLYLRSAAADRHDRLATAAALRRLRRRCRA